MTTYLCHYLHQGESFSTGLINSITNCAVALTLLLPFFLLSCSLSQSALTPGLG